MLKSAFCCVNLKTIVVIFARNNLPNKNVIALTRLGVYAYNRTPWSVGGILAVPSVNDASGHCNLSIYDFDADAATTSVLYSTGSGTWRLNVSNFSGGLASIIRRAGGVTDGRRPQHCCRTDEAGWSRPVTVRWSHFLRGRPTDCRGVRAASVPRGQLTSTDHQRRVSNWNLTSNCANCTTSPLLHGFVITQLLHGHFNDLGISVAEWIHHTACIERSRMKILLRLSAQWNFANISALVCARG